MARILQVLLDGVVAQVHRAGAEQRAEVWAPLPLPPKPGEGRQTLDPALGHCGPFNLRWGPAGEDKDRGLGPITFL